MMDIERWKSQLRKGAADLAVLALLDREPLSGIGLLEKLKTRSDVGLSDGTIYPLLSRLERDKRIAGDWLPSSSGGRATKRYTLTPDGKAALAAMREVWIGFRDGLSSITGDGS